MAYRYIKDKDYKARVKKLTIDNELLDKSDTKLFTQLDTSTLFFVFDQKYFLKPKGKIAFVLPKTTILPAKQHNNFQSKGVTEIHDFSDVSPLFNVRSVLIIRDSRTHLTKNIPGYEYSGKLPLKNMEWISAKKHITSTKRKFEFLSTETKGKYYYPLFLQGATIVPRCFFFVQPDKEAADNKKTPFIETSDGAYKEAKKQWTLKVNGCVERKYFFETVLAKGILPFAIIKTESVFLPLQVFKESIAMAHSERLIELGDIEAAGWMQKTEKLWDSSPQSTKRLLIERLNYNQTLVKQKLNAKYVVLYNTSGTNIAAALFDKKASPKTELPSSGFIAESVTYYYYPKSKAEGLYLVAVLNSSIVNLEIKSLQPQGLFGERHIHRRPFEACAIPKFDKSDQLHIDISQMGQKCTDEVKPLVSQLKGAIGRTRTEVRNYLKSDMAKLDKLVIKLLKSQSQKTLVPKPKGKRSNNHELF